jgi:pantetheine-phosphate adenylyltransferase
MKTGGGMRAIYPGTFDPITNGHIDLITRAREIFDEIIVAVACQPEEKKALFSVEDRVQLVKQATNHLNGVSVEAFDGLMVDYAKKKKIRTVIRGLRMLSDFEYEFQMALTNRKLSSEVETIFLMPKETYAYISSRAIKEVARLGGDIRPFVPEFVAEALKRKQEA